jgi:hypothetical protein
MNAVKKASRSVTMKAKIVSVEKQREYPYFAGIPACFTKR